MCFDETHLFIRFQAMLGADKPSFGQKTISHHNIWQVSLDFHTDAEQESMVCKCLYELQFI